MTTKAKEAEKAEAVKRLRKIVRPGDTVYTVLRHVSASGMSRRIDLYVIRRNRPVFLTGYAGKALEYTHHREGGLVVGGCGMDMGFHLVHSLGYALFGVAEKDTASGRRARRRMAKAQSVKRYLCQGGAAMPDPEVADGCWFGAAGYALNHDWL